MHDLRVLPEPTVMSLLCVGELWRPWWDWTFAARRYNESHVRIQRGYRRSGPPENHKNIRFLAILVWIPWKSQSYQASIQCWAITSTPANRHLNGVSLAGRWWPAYSGIWILPLLINKKKTNRQSLTLTLWQNFLDPRMSPKISRTVSYALNVLYKWLRAFTVIMWSQFHIYIQTKCNWRHLGSPAKR